MNQDNSNQFQNYADVNAEVIGELRKEKIGKPLAAIMMILLFGVVIIAMPIVNKLLSDETSFLYKLVYSKENTTAPSKPEQEFVNASEIQILNNNTKMIYNNLLVLKNFSFSTNSINCTVYSYNGISNLDEDEYYLEIYSSNENKVGYVKLTGIYDNSEVNVTLENNMNFNQNYSYYGKVVLMNDAAYPSVTLNSDESGIGSLTCQNPKETLEYTFKNGYLIGINDKVNISVQGNENYQNELKDYQTKAQDLGDNATVVETTSGFLYTANIDLETYKVPSSVKDYNYFAHDSEVKKVKYNIEGKGFECK